MVEFRLSKLKSLVEVVRFLLWLAPYPKSITFVNGDFSVHKSLKMLQMLQPMPHSTPTFAPCSCPYQKQTHLPTEQPYHLFLALTDQTKPLSLLPKLDRNHLQTSHFF